MAKMKIQKPTNNSFSVKQMIVAYLAVTKVMYWINMLGSMDSFGDFGSAFANRMINQDIMVIVVLIAMHFLEKYIFRDTCENDFWANVKLNCIGLIVFIALMVGYHLLLGLFFEVIINNWLTFIIEWTIIYTIISIFLHLKERMKKKEAELYIPDASDDEGKITMLKALHESNVLTQDEFEDFCANRIPTKEGRDL